MILVYIPKNTGEISLQAMEDFEENVHSIALVHIPNLSSAFIPVD
jgi:hypothetical protein